MSTKSSIFLTNDKNEHCYFEHSDRDENGDIPIYLELSKSNFEVALDDTEDLILKIKPGSELYKLISSIEQD